jgi:hypothetical protein
MIDVSLAELKLMSEKQVYDEFVNHKNAIDLANVRLKKAGDAFENSSEYLRNKQLLSSCKTISKSAELDFEALCKQLELFWV